MPRMRKPLSNCASPKRILTRSIRRRSPAPGTLVRWLGPRRTTAQHDAIAPCTEGAGPWRSSASPPSPLGLWRVLASGGAAKRTLRPARAGPSGRPARGWSAKRLPVPLQAPISGEAVAPATESDWWSSADSTPRARPWAGYSASILGPVACVPAGSLAQPVHDAAAATLGRDRLPVRRRRYILDDGRPGDRRRRHGAGRGSPSGAAIGPRRGHGRRPRLPDRRLRRADPLRRRPANSRRANLLDRGAPPDPGPLPGRRRRRRKPSTSSEARRPTVWPHERSR